MTKFKVVLVTFPFDDLSGSKVRPAVCLTDPIGPHRHVVFAFVTSQISPTLLPTDVLLQSSDPHFATTGLRVSSTLQLHRLVTATTALIQRELGKLPLGLQTQVNDRLRKLFNLK
ncbi:MAG: type II toxin-antitoxin system PemK/MazF family toxin [Chloroflexota bacterium]